MSLAETLKAAGIGTALIIDDGYDEVPLPEDLAADDAAWETFVTDIGSDLDAIKEAFPSYDELDSDQLRQNDQFIATVWALKGKISEALWNGLFSSYESSIRSDRAFLNDLHKKLEDLKIVPTKAGRKFVGKNDQDIFFIDLFLGAAQDSTDVDRSIKLLKELTKERGENPPLVILMSRSAMLEDYRTEFRDKAKLLGAMFRVYRKAELMEGANLSRLLERLAMHAADSRKVATLLYQLEHGFDVAKNSFLKIVRRLDLSDYAQIRSLLLDREGQPLGSYVLDVFDRVLQHEIEGSEAVITAASELTTIDPDNYPPPYIAGTPDLQDLVHRTLWQNTKRLNVKNTIANIPVAFGDFLVKRSYLAKGVTPEDTEVMVVMTPACDLVRNGGVRTVLLMTGSINELTPKDWKYGDVSLRTPILIFPDGKRVWISWDVKHPQAMTAAALSQLLTPEGGTHSIAARFRENQAIEIQQQILADLGRVGLIVKMPATFPVSMSAGYMNSQSALVPLELPKATASGGVCYFGQGTDGNDYSKLVLTESVIDELLLAIEKIDDNDIHTRAKDALADLKGTTSLSSNLQKGIKIASNGSYVELKVQKNGNDGNPISVQVGYMAKNPGDSLPNVKNAAIIITVVDITPT